MKKKILNDPMKTVVLSFLFCFFISISLVFARQFPGHGDTTLLYDYPNLLDKEEQLSLEKKLQEQSENIGGSVLVILTKGKKYADSLAIHAAQAKSSDKLIIITADVSNNSYGFFVSDELKGKFPHWVIEKIQNNFIKKNFREKQYFNGLDQAVEVVSGIATGEMDSEDLRKHSSNSTILILIAVVLFFLFIFPVIQYFRMKRNHFTSKQVDLVSSVLLTNTFGTRGKNLFDDFSSASGKFAEHNTAPSGSGGIGIEGSW